MWKKIDEKEKHKACKSLIKEYSIHRKKNWGRILMFCIAFAILISLIHSFPNRLKPNQMMPSFQVLIRNAAFFSIGGLIASVVVWVIYFFSFELRSTDEKIEYIYNRSFTSTQKICSKCQITYDAYEQCCKRCGNQLDHLKDYIWVDE